MLAKYSGYEGFIKDHEKTIQAQNTNNMPKKQTSFEEKEGILAELNPNLNSDLLNECCGLILRSVYSC